MILEILMIFLTICGLLIGTITDLKTREIPDWLTYFLVASGLGIRAIISLSQQNPAVFLSGLFGFAVMFLLALLMFYTGQWGGGDAKLLMGIGAMMGFKLSPDTFLFGFLIHLILIGAVYGFFYSLFLAASHSRNFTKAWNIMPFKKYEPAVWLVAVAPFLFGLFYQELFFLLFLFALLVVGSYYLFIFMKVVEQVCMIKEISVERLTEGDWVVSDIMVKGKYMCGPKDLGITDEQIKELKRTKIRKIVIKEGIPFVPTFLLAYLATLLWNNWFIDLFIKTLL